MTTRNTTPSIRPSLISSACSATAIRAGSATTAANPMAKPKVSSSPRAPRRVNWLARFLPTGNTLRSRPWRNRAIPTPTISRPATSWIGSSGIRRKTSSWKATTTATMGNRFLRAFRNS